MQMINLGKKIVCALSICAIILTSNIYISAADFWTGGNATSQSAYGEIDFLYSDCVKTYADGKKVIRNFGYYLKRDKSYRTIPGLINTNVKGSNCVDMAPQGFCHMDNYTLITAYCYQGEHKPVIYVLDATSLVATIVLPYDIHAGGITYDGEWVWIANGKTNYAEDSKNYLSSSKYVYYITKNQLLKAINMSRERKAKSVTIAGLGATSQRISLSFDPAYCTYFEGILWLGKFNSAGVDMMYGYTVSHTNTQKIVKVGDMQVPRATQGLAFYRYNNKVYLVTSNSWRRSTKYGNVEHKLIVYEPYDYDLWNARGGENRDYHKGSRICDLIIPLMSENAEARSSSLFLIFESCAKEYRKDVDVPLRCDKFCELDFKKVCVD